MSQQASDRFSYSSAPVRRIKSIQFGILDPDFIVRAVLRPPLLAMIARRIECARWNLASRSSWLVSRAHVARMLLLNV
jgi:hypothetical protein